ncbi:hypothetical protein TVNIR_1318 [Thioalkalivibrio nitratireducens DSM 14787]|uniref:Uncharacterized protein n=1 Tax=Thioalkalivibrio nitratireducens (strain DSM 14787 / UNIQEM 213 / ALEN2) TaxID=1255043 RepID=L0DXB3_THIND|nr:hypothetical protein [Thioalkalivibrio nitratireducens]AGA32991.1 hypothetical protein TVNIR_1318 [Thioalkalivibrio nitratireducens DSM 14787]
MSILAPPASGHALLHQVLEGDAVLVRFHFSDGDRPYFETYQVLGPDDARPFQTGRINALGEVSFRPNRPGRWKVIVATEDGHGAEARIDVDPGSLAVADPGGAGLAQAARLSAGVGYLLGAFGIVALWRLQRARRSRG